MKIVGIGAIAVVVLVVAAFLAFGFYNRLENPKVAAELRKNPDGLRAQRVMLLTLPSGRELPVNYLEKDGAIYAAADGCWWRELRGEGSEVTLLVKGREFTGHARAIEDDPKKRSRIFEELRPGAPKLFGVMVEVVPDD